MTTLNNGLQYPASSNGNLLFGWKLGSWAASVLSAALRFSKQCSSSPGHGMQRPLRSHQHSIQMSSHHTAPGQGGTHRTPAFNGWGGGILVQHQGKTTRGQRPIICRISLEEAAAAVMPAVIECLWEGGDWTSAFLLPNLRHACLICILDP